MKIPLLFENSLAPGKVFEAFDQAEDVYYGDIIATEEFTAFPGSENIPAEYVTIRRLDGSVVRGWRHQSVCSGYCICLLP